MLTSSAELGIVYFESILEHSYDVIKIFCVVKTEECNSVANSEESFGTTEYLTLYTGCSINLCRYNRVQLFLSSPCLIILTEFLHIFTFSSFKECSLHYTASSTVNPHSTPRPSDVI